MFNYGLCGRAFGLVRVSWPPHPGDTACTAECVGFVAFLCECFTVSICKDQVFMDIQSNVQVCVHVMEGMGRGGGGGGRSVLSLHSDVNFSCGLCWTLIQRVGFFFSLFLFHVQAFSDGIHEHGNLHSCHLSCSSLPHSPLSLYLPLLCSKCPLNLHPPPGSPFVQPLLPLPASISLKLFFPLSLPL